MPSHLALSQWRTGERIKVQFFCHQLGAALEVWFPLRAPHRIRLRLACCLPAFPSLPCSPISRDNSSGSACSVNPMHVKSSSQVLLLGNLDSRCQQQPLPPHDHLSSLRQHHCDCGWGRLHNTLPSANALCRHGHPLADAWEEGDMQEEAGKEMTTRYSEAPRWKDSAETVRNELKHNSPTPCYATLDVDPIW